MENTKIIDFQEEDFEQSIDIRDYLAVLRKRVPVIITIFFVVFSWQVLRTYTTTPLYTSSSNVLIERYQGSSNIERDYSNSYDPFFMSTQSAIIRSQHVAKRVVENLALDKKYKKFFISAGPPKKNFFRSTLSSVKKTVKSIFSAEKKVVDQDMGLPGADVLRPQPSSEADTIANIISGGLRVNPLPNSNIFKISYSHKNPAIAKLVAEAIVQAYKEISLEIKHSSSNYTLQWMTEKAEEERRKLEETESALQQYKRVNDLVTVGNRLTVTPEKLSQLNSELTRAQTERKELGDAYAQIKNAKSDISKLESIPIFASNGVIQTIREKVFRAKQNIKELSKKYGPKHPKMINARDELDILTNELKFEVNRIIASTKNSYELVQSREANLKNQLAKTKSELLNYNEKFVQLSIMQREVDTNRLLYDALIASIKKTGVTEQSQSVNIWVARKAFMPRYPSYPNKKRSLAIGLLVGLALGVAVAFMLEYLDNTIKSEKDLMAKYDLTILGTVRYLKESKEKIESFIISKPLSPIAESYRLVRSNILLSSAGHPPKSILITSMGPQEGKSSTVINLARVLSQNDKKVLIIDCDLRRSRLHKIFGMENKAGLSNYLSGNVTSNIITDVPGEDMKLITSGLTPPNPAELLNSDKMKMLVNKMSEIFDFILLDSPPIQRVTDSLALSQMVEGTIVVVRARKTSYEMLYSGMRKLKDTNTNLLGFVLNGVKDSDLNNDYYTGYKSYYAQDA